jgi:hypothetical protein
MTTASKLTLGLQKLALDLVRPCQHRPHGAKAITPAGDCSLR